MEMNRQDRFHWLAGTEANPTGIFRSNTDYSSEPSRVVQWARQVTSIAEMHEFFLIELMWASLPDLLILLWSPVFWKGIKQEAWHLQMPVGWSLSVRFQDYLSQADKSPDRFWAEWEHLVMNRALMTRYKLYFKHCITEEECLLLQTGFLLRMAWYLSGMYTFAPNFRSHFDPLIDMPAYDPEGPTVGDFYAQDFGAVLAEKCLVCEKLLPVPAGGLKPLLIGHVTGFRNKAEFHESGCCVSSLQKISGRYDSGDGQRNLYGNHCDLVFHA